MGNLIQNKEKYRDLAVSMHEQEHTNKGIYSTATTTLRQQDFIYRSQDGTIIQGNTPIVSNSVKLFDHNNITWILRETLYEEGELKGQAHIEIYDPMSLDSAEFQIYITTDNIYSLEYWKNKQAFVDETTEDIKRIYKED